MTDACKRQIPGQPGAGLREKKGFWTNGESEFAKKNNGFDSNGVLDLREKKDGFWTNGRIEFAKEMMGLIITEY